MVCATRPISRVEATPVCAKRQSSPLKMPEIRLCRSTLRWGVTREQQLLVAQKLALVDGADRLSDLDDREEAQRFRSHGGPQSRPIGRQPLGDLVTAARDRFDAWGNTLLIC